MDAAGPAGAVQSCRYPLLSGSPLNLWPVPCYQGGTASTRQVFAPLQRILDAMIGAAAYIHDSRLDMIGSSALVRVTSTCTVRVVTSIRSKPRKVRAMSSQQVIDLSSSKWRWMSEKNVDALSGLFHRDAVFVHMGATFARDQELEIIRTGGIVYRRADIESVSVPLLNDHTAIVLTTMQLVAVVGGNEVTNPFVVTEVFVREKAQWQLASMSFTRLLTAAPA